MTIGPTVGEALVEFRKACGLDDECATTSWTCRLGPLAVRLPNFNWRRRAILAHDLHHLLTGFPCTMRGEFQMAAWEFGAGPMPHWGATLFCLPLVLAGSLWAPSRMLRAFVAGRRSRSLHGSRAIDYLLIAPLDLAKTHVANQIGVQPSRFDRVCFAVLILKAGLLTVWPLLVLAGLWTFLGG